MAVQKSRVSPSRKGMRRAHDALSAKQLSTDPTSGETHLRHHVTADGYYRGKKVIETIPDGCGLAAPTRRRTRWRRASCRRKPHGLRRQPDNNR